MYSTTSYQVYRFQTSVERDGANPFLTGLMNTFQHSSKWWWGWVNPTWAPNADLSWRIGADNWGNYPGNWADDFRQRCTDLTSKHISAWSTLPLTFHRDLDLESISTKMLMFYHCLFCRSCGFFFLFGRVGLRGLSFSPHSSLPPPIMRLVSLTPTGPGLPPVWLAFWSDFSETKKKKKIMFPTMEAQYKGQTTLDLDWFFFYFVHFSTSKLN